MPDNSRSRRPSASCPLATHVKPHAISTFLAHTQSALSGAHWRGGPPPNPAIPRRPPPAARRPPGTSWKIPVTCARPRPRASPRPQRPQPALAPQGSRAAGFTRPRGPGWPALLKRPGTHHHAGTAGRHDGIGRRARAKAV